MGDSIMCQDLCHSFSNCHFFRFEKSSSEENCMLFESSYRETCKIVAAPIHRDVNACLTSTDETCDKIISESCEYLGEEIYTTPPGSTLDSDSCDELCIDYERLDCSHWMYNKVEKQCTLYDSSDSDCSFISGPEQPSIESCIEGVSSTTSTSTTTTATATTTTTTTTTKATTATTTSTTTRKTTTSSEECIRNSDCYGNACDTTTNKCYIYESNHHCLGSQIVLGLHSFDDAVEKCNTDSSCGCVNDTDNDGIYSTRYGTEYETSSGSSAWVKN